MNTRRTLGNKSEWTQSVERNEDIVDVVASLSWHGVTCHTLTLPGSDRCVMYEPILRAVIYSSAASSGRQTRPRQGDDCSNNLGGHVRCRRQAVKTDRRKILRIYVRVAFNWRHRAVRRIWTRSLSSLTVISSYTMRWNYNFCYLKFNLVELKFLTKTEKKPEIEIWTHYN